MTGNNEIENIMLEEQIINKNLKKHKKSYKNPNSKALTHKIGKLIKN